MNKPTLPMKKACLAVIAAVCAMCLMGCSAVNDVMATDAPTGAPSPSAEALNSAAPTAMSEFKDGTYTAQASDAYTEQNQGWREYVTLTVSGGQVTDVEYDVEKDGQKKSLTTQEEYPMDPHPSQWIPELESQLKMADGDLANIDGITGATQSTEMAKRLYAAALNAARTGDTMTVTLADDAATPEEQSTAPQTTNQEGGQE